MRHGDGTVHSSSVPLLPPDPRPAVAAGSQRGVVLAVYPPGHEANVQGVCVECDVLLYRDQRVLYAVPVAQPMGARDGELWEPSPTTKSLATGDALTFSRTEENGICQFATQVKDLDGDHVRVEFVNGSYDQPLIVGRLPHPQAANKSRPVADAAPITADAHPATPDGNVLWAQRAGSRVLLDRRGNAVIDTTGAGVENSGDAIEGDEPKGTVYVQAREGERVVVSVGGVVRAVIDGDSITLAQGTKGVARKDDDVSVDLADPQNVSSKWSEFFTKLVAAIQTIDGTFEMPKQPIHGTITNASSQVKAG